jgi:hypothetical protein
LMPSLPSTTTYLEALHVGQCVASSWSSMNRTHPYGQEWIGSYGILSARRSLCDSYVFFGRMWSSESSPPKTDNTRSKLSRLMPSCDFKAIRCEMLSSCETLVLS